MFLYHHIKPLRKEAGVDGQVSKVRDFGNKWQLLRSVTLTK